MKYLEQMGHNSQAVLQDIKATIIKTICAVQPTLAHTYRSCQPDDVENSMCFELLGFDIFLDDDELSRPFGKMKDPTMLMGTTNMYRS